MAKKRITKPKGAEAAEGSLHLKQLRHDLEAGLEALGAIVALLDTPGGKAGELVDLATRYRDIFVVIVRDSCKILQLGEAGE